MIRLFALLGIFVLAACAGANDLNRDVPYLGNFHLGHNVVVAPNLTKGPASREATKEEWVEAMTQAISDRLGRHEGTRLYHLGVSVEGYVLAIPGVPLLISPKSALILNVTAWDDAAGRKLNDKPHMITVMESISGNTILGSGLTQSKEVQMANLSRNAARLIENWLNRQNDEFGWFEDDGRPANEKIGLISGRPETRPEPPEAAPALVPAE
ncbi:hypothetical protein [Roseovarius autotrophicus]|uniref:hypothetical protein n=1 Tax=Roseovarius autotrophicus TaxID=2824121 RepID=UPI0019E90B1D|nr:hypothetical protein [Roseovarius autotrophicus]MBE0453028.1 hypothetical protein [Roseovarius sp.]